MGKLFSEKPATSYTPFSRYSETVSLKKAKQALKDGTIDLDTVESIVIDGKTITDKDDIRKLLK